MNSDFGLIVFPLISKESVHSQQTTELGKKKYLIPYQQVSLPEEIRIPTDDPIGQGKWLVVEAILNLVHQNHLESLLRNIFLDLPSRFLIPKARVKHCNAGLVITF